MTTEELLQQVRLTHRQNHLRFGQALFNAAPSGVADEVVGTRDDPYGATSEHDPRVQAFVARIREVLG